MPQSFLNYYRGLSASFEAKKERIRDWFLVRAHGAHANAWLAAISFAEASFFPFPAEMLYLPILLAGAARWVYYATLTTLSSVVGGAFGYAIGAFLFSLVGEFIVTTYGLRDEMLHLAEQFAEGAFLAIFIGAFTPIPYKIFTITAGFFSINFALFILASLLGRGLRYFALGFLMNRYGDALGGMLFRHFNIATFAVVIIVIVIFIVAQFF